MLDSASVKTLTDLADAVGPEGVAQLIELFIEEAPKSRASLVTAIEQADAGELRRAAHSLKSASGYLGLHDLSDIALQVESMVLEGRHQDAIETARSLPDLLDGTVESLTGHLQQIAAQ